MRSDFFYSTETKPPMMVREEQVARSVAEAGADWAKDGTATEAPVTTSTPAEASTNPENPPPVESSRPAGTDTPAGAAAPAVEERQPTLSEASAAWVKKGIETPAGAAPTSAAQAGAQAASAAAAEGASPAEQAAAAAAGAQKFIDGQLDGKPFQVPEGVLVPITVKGATVFKPLSEVMASGMRLEDYSRKSAQNAERARAINAQSVQQRAEAARLAEQQRQIDADKAELEAARNDPQKYEELQEHQRLYATNPIYKKNVDDAREKALADAQLRVYEEEATATTVQTTAEAVQQAIETYSADYPGVDPEIVRANYAAALVQGTADLTEATLRSFFKAEADRVATVAAPFRTEVESLRAELAELKRNQTSAATAAAHNAQADRILARDGMGRFTKPSTQAPQVGGVVRKREPYAGNLNQPNQRHKDWIAGGN